VNGVFLLHRFEGSHRERLGSSEVPAAVRLRLFFFVDIELSVTEHVKR